MKTSDASYNQATVLHLANKYPNEFLKDICKYKNFVSDQFLEEAINLAKSILKETDKRHE